MEEKVDGGGVSALCLVARRKVRSRPLERVIAATIIFPNQMSPGPWSPLRYMSEADAPSKRK